LIDLSHYKIKASLKLSLALSRCPIGGLEISMMIFSKPDDRFATIYNILDFRLFHSKVV